MIQQVLKPRQRARRTAGRPGHATFFGTVDLFGLQRFEEGDRLAHAFDQFRERLLGVLERRRLQSGEARRAGLRHVGSDLHLPAEREHVREQRALHQHRWVDFAASACAAAFSRMATRLVSMSMKTGTEAWYMEIASWVTPGKALVTRSGRRGRRSPCMDRRPRARQPRTWSSLRVTAARLARHVHGSGRPLLPARGCSVLRSGR